MRKKDQKNNSAKDQVKPPPRKPEEKPTSKNATIEDAPAPRAEQAP